MALRNRTSLDVGYGLSNGLQGLSPLPVVANRAPTTSDTAPIGTQWIWSAQNEAWELTSISGGSANWQQIPFSGGAASFTSLTVNPGPVNMLTDTATATGNFGTGAGVKTISIGSGTGASSTTIRGGTGQVSILNNANVAGAITLETNGGTTETIAITNEQGTGAGSISIISSVGGININGNNNLTLAGGGDITVAPSNVTAASPTSTVTANNNVIKATFTGFTTGHGAYQTYTINSSKILATSAIMASVTNLNASGNDAALTINGTNQAAGVMNINTLNSGLGGTGGDLGAGDNVIITLWIMS